MRERKVNSLSNRELNRLAFPIKILLNQILNKWRFYMLIIGAMVIMTLLSKACPEYKIAYILLELICFILSTKFYDDSISKDKLNRGGK